MNGVQIGNDALEPIGLEAVTVVLKKCLGTDRFVLKSFDLKPAGDGLLGFLGNHLRLTANYALDGKTNKLSLFVKTTPRDNQNRSDFGNQYGMFEREAFVYNKIFTLFGDDEETKAWRPKCLLSIENDLIMEDLNVKGFKMLDNKIPLNKEHILTALTTLARFHAASFKLEEKRSIKTNTKYRLHNEFQITDSLFSYNTWFQNCMTTALTIVAEKSNKYGKDTTYFETIKQNWDRHSKEGVEQSGPSKEFRNVLCHCDLWNNNFMFRYDDNGKPVQGVLVDFQACQYSAPASDIMSFIYINVSKQLRDSSMKEFIKHYYTELKITLLESGLLVENVLPWSSFENSCDVCKKWGLVQSMINYQFCFLDGNEVLQHINTSNGFSNFMHHSRAELVMKTLKDGPLLTERFMPILEDFIELYILKE